MSTECVLMFDLLVDMTWTMVLTVFLQDPSRPDLLRPAQSCSAW